METFILTQTQFNDWDNFCLDNGKIMYENEDCYMNEYNENSKLFVVHVPASEQSGIINFLQKLLDNKWRREYNASHQQSSQIGENIWH